ncbi:hypothetical protein BO71DRAFT_104694 [Aspergillus ellipticus CBS 707.79]|uniref:Uncharacterized protein n=1 Tax=Aspergillus ellipticus CBS 707.79 TaxID=1448320 RepID=A0A319DNE2_9EURO|nr:hypothetical protein BO71DRAFT_104694 [Aspergillus ellipticus CBS 707.79]
MCLVLILLIYGHKLSIHKQSAHKTSLQNQPAQHSPSTNLPISQHLTLNQHYDPSHHSNRITAQSTLPSPPPSSPRSTLHPPTQTPPKGPVHPNHPSGPPRHDGGSHRAADTMTRQICRPDGLFASRGLPATEFRAGQSRRDDLLCTWLVWS